MSRLHINSQNDSTTRWITAILWVLIFAYAAFFSAYTLQRHATFNTFAADLSFIDQPMWNTVHGRFLERTLDDRQASRVAEHLEPILLPISLIYLVWDDVRAILILQSLALAVGALPVFWLARDVLGRDRQASWLGLAFAAAYLLFPALQAANIADFHADPFVVAPLLFAFWYARQRRWRPMWAWALLAMATKENLPTLTAMLGLYLLLGDKKAWRALRSDGNLRQRVAAFLAQSKGGSVQHGLMLTVVSLGWFFIATFLIVQPLAREVYGTDAPIYLANRYVQFTGGPSGWLHGTVSALREPARLDYVTGLLASVGWLPLLAPQYLVVGLPVLVANFFSNFPGQFSGEQHYSAPLVAVFVIAAIFGAQRLIALAERATGFQLTGRFSNRALFGALVGVWLLAWSFGQQADRGWTPLARTFHWPERTAHHRLFGRFTAQIPAAAAVSTTPALHPHLAHRQRIYLFPIIKDAEYVLVDVAGITDMHPADIKTKLEELLASGEFGIQDAADGYVLLARNATGTTWPDAFFDFARGDDRRPQYPLSIRFGPHIQLLGYDLVDDPRWRLTRFRWYFRTSAPLPLGIVIRYQALTPSGSVADDDTLRPAPALLWYPPHRWRPDEVVIIETLPWFLPRAWAPTLAVIVDDHPLPVEALGEQGSDDATAVSADGRVRLPAWGRKDGRLVVLDAPLTPIYEARARFSEGEWTVSLDAWSAPVAVAPGHNLDVALRWRSSGSAPADYHIFLHLRDATNRTVAQGDAGPTWFLPQPTSTWRTTTVWTAHTLAIPAEIAPGRYDLVVGWYDWQTGQRLETIGETGNSTGNEHVLGPVVVDRFAAPRPDICCLFEHTCCASLE